METSESLLTQTMSHPLLLEEAEEIVVLAEAEEEADDIVVLKVAEEETEEMVVLEEVETQVSVFACLKHEKIYISS